MLEIIIRYKRSNKCQYKALLSIGAISASLLIGGINPLIVNAATTNSGTIEIPSDDWDDGDDFVVQHAFDDFFGHFRHSFLIQLQHFV